MSQHKNKGSSSLALLLRSSSITGHSVFQSWIASFSTSFYYNMCVKVYNSLKDLLLINCSIIDPKYVWQTPERNWTEQIGHSPLHSTVLYFRDTTQDQVFIEIVWIMLHFTFVETIELSEMKEIIVALYEIRARICHSLFGWWGVD